MPTIQAPDFFSESGKEIRSQIQESLKNYRMNIHYHPDKENMNVPQNYSSRAMLYAEEETGPVIESEKNQNVLEE